MKETSALKIIFAVLAITTFSVFVFQNCAKVSFHGSGSSSQMADIENQPTETNEPPAAEAMGPGNGDAYDGKVTYYQHWSEIGECEPDISTVKNQIEETEKFFVLTIEDCQTIPAMQIDSTEITVVADGIIYRNENYITEIPQSCFEIYDNGGDNPSGLYWLDTDGEGPKKPEFKYCDMALVSQGWGAWGDWSECDSACGLGSQFRERVCGAGTCHGESQQTRECQKATCP